MIRLPLAVFCLILLINNTFGQSTRSKSTFVPPLEIPLVLSGNFGEIRSNHFHSGLDFKTNRQSGYQVFSIDAGYISRIKIQGGGYGKAVYVQHPDGFVSVYGHLMKFRQDIEEYVKAQQYKQERFAVDLYLNAGTFPLEKGAYFALSGNTGSSQAPHLHFEIRDGQTQNPLNPLHYNFKVNDQTPPLLKSIYLYSLVGRKDLRPKVVVPLTGRNGQYYPSVNQVFPVDEIAGVGIETIDFLDDANNPCGVYQLEVFLDGELISGIKMDEFSFAESKYINSFIDYEEYVRERNQILKTFVEPNNHLSIYQFLKNQGKLLMNDSTEHLLTVRVEDVHGNSSSTQIRLRLDPMEYNDYDYSKTYYAAFFNYAETNHFENNGIELRIAPNSLYDDVYFTYRSDAKIPGYYSRIHQVHHPYTPLHRSMTLRIKPDSLPEHLRHQALIARINEKGSVSAIGGKWSDQMLEVQAATFGSYFITVDTLPPQIIAVNLVKTEPATIGSDIRFIIRDDFSGISSFRGTLNGQWILFEYDPKSALLKHITDPDVFPTGETRELMLQVKDRVGNIAEYKQQIYR